jgi:hypothetical protein
MSTRTPAARQLPERPNLDHLKTEAKRRLAEMRLGAPHAKLADAQFALARDYGFASWRELKARVESVEWRGSTRALGDWIGVLPPDVRVALHVRVGSDGAVRATLDSPDFAGYDIPVDEFAASEDRLSFALLHPEANATYDAIWEEAAQQWSGRWLQNGMATALTFSRGAFPPAPTVAGLDGVWDGVLETAGGARLILHVRTGAHGTLATLDSPDRRGGRYPARSIHRAGCDVTIEMRTATITGVLSEDGAQMDACFTRDGRTHPLLLRRRARGAPPPRRPHPPSVALAPEVLARYVGEYRCGSMAAEVAVSGGELQVSFAGQPQLTVLAASPTEFFWRDLDMEAVFELDSRGDPTGFVLRRDARDSRYTRISS